MLISLLVTVLLALLAGAMVWLMFRVIRRRPPAYLIPAAIGATMLAFTIWNEYSWASRTVAALPAGVEVIDRIAGSTPWQPWTYIFPRTDRMVALDRPSTRTNDRLPGRRLVELVLLERLMPARRTALIIDCSDARQANVAADAAGLDDTGMGAAHWAPMRRDGALFRAVCQPETTPSPSPSPLPSPSAPGHP